MTVCCRNLEEKKFEKGNFQLRKPRKQFSDVYNVKWSAFLNDTILGNYERLMLPENQLT